jgi:hypothetical protein
MEQEGSLLCSYQAATGPDPQRDEPNPNPPNSVSKEAIVMLSCHLCLGLQCGLFSSDFPTKFLYKLLISPIHATCPVRPIFLHFFILVIFGEKYKLCSSSLCNFHQVPVTSSLFGPNIILTTLFSNTLNLCSSLMLGIRFYTIQNKR